jgi:hypothetical protein
VKRKHLIRELLRLKSRMPEPHRVATCACCVYVYQVPVKKKRPDICEACEEQFGGSDD